MKPKKKKILKLPPVLQSSNDLSGMEKRLRVGSISYEAKKKNTRRSKVVTSKQSSGKKALKTLKTSKFPGNF